MRRILVRRVVPAAVAVAALVVVAAPAGARPEPVIRPGGVGVHGAAPAPGPRGAGALDPRFGDEGVVVTATAPDALPDFQNGLLVDRRDRIVVSGSSDLGKARGVQWRVARYLPRGRLDHTFGTGGTVFTRMSKAGGADYHIWRIALQADGRIVAAGQAATGARGIDFALARYLPDGRLDKSFGHRGRVFTSIGPGRADDVAQDVRVLRDGKILVAGYTGADVAGRDFALARYRSDGSLDRTFNPEGPRRGIVVTDVAGQRDQIRAMTLDKVGRIVVVGSATLAAGAGATNFAVARYQPAGRLDTSFGPRGAHPGIVTTAMAAGDRVDLAFAVAVDGYARIVAGGSADTGGRFDLALARYNGNGSLDGSFGAGGEVVTNVGPGDTDEDLQALLLQRDGKIVIGGSTAPTAFLVDSDFLVARYDTHGRLDPTFGDAGVTVTRTGAGSGDDEIYDLAFTKEGQLIASGECDQPATGRDVCLARYRLDGRHGQLAMRGTPGS